MTEHTVKKNLPASTLRRQQQKKKKVAGKISRPPKGARRNTAAAATKGHGPPGGGGASRFVLVGPILEDDYLESPKIVLNVGNNLVGDGTSSSQTSSLQDHSSDTIKSEKTTSGGPLKQPAGVMRVPTSELNELNLSERKPIVRSKVPFEKGYSQMDWLKLTRTHPDLAGLKGLSNRRRITMEEVRQHKTEGSIWTVLKGHVYNISPYMKFHPG
ncbi:hypothetical protein Taro_026535, partial [Colocasia esculenta]|nr:hypothetical protein [Colocasia esculenta]